MSVNKAKQALEEAENKVQLIKKWNRDFSSQVEPLGKQMERLHTLLANELPGAVAHLGSIIKTLHDYADVGSPGEMPAPTPLPEKESSEALPDSEQPNEEDKT